MTAPTIGCARSIAATAQLNWSHPLAHGLVFYVFRASTAGNVNDPGVTFTTVSAGSPALNPANGFTTMASMDRENRAAIDFAFTAIMGQSISGTNQAHIGSSFANGTSRNAICVWRQNTSVASGQITMNDFGSTMCWVYPGSGNTLVYENGVYRGTVTSNFSTITKVGVASGGLTSVGPRISSGAAGVVGNFGAAWQRPLSEQEVQAMTVDPYQLLRY